MAKINILNAVIGVGVGGVDEFLEEKDAADGRIEETKKWSVWYRAAGVGLGLLGQAMNIMPKYAEPLAQSTLPLLTKTAYKMVKAGSPTTTQASVSRSRVSMMGRISQTTKPEFEGQRSY